MKKKKSAALIVLSFIAFISLGLPDGLLGVAWPGIHGEFGLPLDALGLLLIFSTAGYTLSSFFSGPLVRRLGIGGLLTLSCGATSAALFVYAVTPFWWLFVGAAALGGLGAGAIDAGINSYVESNHSERMMQWLHASFGIGITMGPVIMTLGIRMTSRWQSGYFIVSLAQAALAIIFLMTKGLWKSVDSIPAGKEPVKKEASLGETFKNSKTILSMVMFFLYVGFEVGLGLWSYSLLTISRGVDTTLAGFVTGSYWAMFTFGRVCAGWYTHKLTVTKVLYISFILAFAGVFLLFLNTGNWVSVLGIALIGFSIAPVFPSLISDTANRVGVRHTANTIGMQISAAGFGAALVPSLAGVLARIYGLEVIPLYMMVTLALLFGLFILSRPRRRREPSIK
ncbi:MAG: MFS transporter [Spirochaetales bacterium]|nr:MFS transporter [Spirochaetales bacterium]